MTRRVAYVISDLHLGGRAADPNVPGDLGFRMCSHTQHLAEFIRRIAAKPAGGPGTGRPFVELVINGDFVDFLAEEIPGAREGEPRWSAFHRDPRVAVAVLDNVMAREPHVFDALHSLLATGHGLTILLGNHDLELSLPAVRARLEERIGAFAARGYRFIDDNRAYRIGDALIEHGNRYDRLNQADHDQLRAVRSMQSRGVDDPGAVELVPPPGSRLVAEAMNPLKARFRFVDLLKPETEAVVPLLLALDPGVRKHAFAAVKMAWRARNHGMRKDDITPRHGGDISSRSPAPTPMGGPMGGPRSAPVASDSQVLAEIMGAEEAAAFEQALGDTATTVRGGDISSRGFAQTAWSFAQLLTADEKAALETRMPALLGALRSMQKDRHFEHTSEPDSEFRRAAAKMLDAGHRYVVFGHTHFCRHVPLGDRGDYLNTGTWADRILFPDELIEGDDGDATERLQAFMGDLIEGRFAKWLAYRPTYVRITEDGGGTTSARVHEYRDGDLDDEASALSVGERVEM